MARKMNDRYVRYYTFGSAAPKLEEQKRGAALPKYKKPEKRMPLPFDPIAFLGSAVAVVLAVLMLIGMVQVAGAASQVHELQTQLTVLEQQEQMLLERYQAGYDLNEVRVAAESMGMIPAEEAVHVRVEVPVQTVEVPQVSWWDSVLMQLRQFFA